MAKVNGVPEDLARSTYGFISPAVLTTFLNLLARVIACPLRLSIHGMINGFMGEPSRPMVEANGMPVSMCVAWFSPSESLARMAAHDASLEITEPTPNLLRYPSSCAL